MEYELSIWVGFLKFNFQRVVRSYCLNGAASPWLAAFDSLFLQVAATWATQNNCVYDEKQRMLHQMLREI